ncbi:methylmalonyl-CoA epimerase mitochondrial precursor [Umbelopsis sp. AD052]|nr:methylmalonyl-CoA epimerase mitochondrial precursor [Umbelopsis sp. AD052]
MFRFLAKTSLQTTAVRSSVTPARVAPLAARSFTTGSGDSKSDAIWKLGQLNHVAIAVPDLEKSTQFYKTVMGAQVSGVQELPEHGVSTVFVSLGNTKIELLHPLGEKSPIAKFLEKNKDGGIHHICIEVDDVYAAIKDLTAKNIRALNPEPKIGAHNKPVVFLHPKDCGGVLVELEQR